MSEEIHKSTKNRWYVWQELDSSGSLSRFQTTIVGEDYMDGVKNPHWKAQIRAQVNAGTNLSAGKEEFPRKLFSNGYLWTFYSPLTNPPTHSFGYKRTYGYYTVAQAYPPDITDLETKANNKALMLLNKKLSDHRHAISGGVVLGELPRTLQLLLNPAKTLRRGIGDYLDSLKKRRPNRRGLSRAKFREKAIKTVSDTWLEYVYGWLPLVSDIHDAAKALADQKYNVNPPIMRLKAAAKFEKSRHVTSYPQLYNNLGSYVDYLNKGSVEVIYRVGVGDGPSALNEGLTKVGLDLRSFVPTLWELIPYSFVVDYFTNIGDIIYSYSQRKNRVRWVMKTVRVEKSYTAVNLRPRYDVPMGYTFISGGRWYYREPTSYTPGAASLKEKTITRTRYQGSLVPDFEFSIPGLSLKWINLAALALGTSQVRKLYSV